MVFKQQIDFGGLDLRSRTIYLVFDTAGQLDHTTRVGDVDFEDLNAEDLTIIGSFCRYVAEKSVPVNRQ